MAFVLLSKAKERYICAHESAKAAFLAQRAHVDALYSAKTSKEIKQQIRMQNTVLEERKADVAAAAARVDAVTMDCVTEADWLAMLEKYAPLINKLKPAFRAAFERVRSNRTPALLRLISSIATEDYEVREWRAMKDREYRDAFKSGRDVREDHLGYTIKNPLTLADFAIDAVADDKTEK